MPLYNDPLASILDLYKTPLKPGAAAAAGPSSSSTGEVVPTEPGTQAGSAVTPSNPLGMPTVYPGGSGPPPTTGVYAPFGGPTSDAPPAWLARNALNAFQSGDTKYRDHLLADPFIQSDPHLKNFINGLFAGDADRLKEAQYYATNPSYNGWNNAAGNGIPGDFL